MKMSKILSLALAVCMLCVALVGCQMGGNTTTSSDTSSSTTSSEPAGESYTVTFYGPGDDPMILFTLPIAAGEVLPAAPSFTGLASGEVFGGWFTQPGGQGAEYTAGAAVEDDISYYAYVTVPAEMIDITFKNGDMEYTVQIEKGTAVGDRAPADPTKAGEKFAGWFSDTVQFAADAEYDTAMLFEARFEAAHVVVFKVGDEIVNTQYVTPDENPDKLHKEDDKAAHLITMPAEPVAPAGQIFVGWFDEDGRQLHTGTIRNWIGGLAWRDVTYTARFAEAHTVTFVDENGDTISTVTVADGANAPIPAAPSGFYYDFMLDQISDIKADATVQLTTVPVSGYSQWGPSLTSNTSDDRITTAGVIEKGYALLFCKADDEVTFEVDAIGDFQAYFGLSDGAIKQQQQNGQIFIFNITIDGVDMGEYIGDQGPDWVTLFTLPSGQHTITIKLVDVIGGTADGSSGYMITAARINVK